MHGLRADTCAHRSGGGDGGRGAHLPTGGGRSGGGRLAGHAGASGGAGAGAACGERAAGGCSEAAAAAATRASQGRAAVGARLSIDRRARRRPPAPLRAPPARPARLNAVTITHPSRPHRARDAPPPPLGQIHTHKELPQIANRLSGNSEMIDGAPRPQVPRRAYAPPRPRPDPTPIHVYQSRFPTTINPPAPAMY